MSNSTPKQKTKTSTPKGKKAVKALPAKSKTTSKSKPTVQSKATSRIETPKKSIKSINKTKKAIGKTKKTTASIAAKTTSKPVTKQAPSSLKELQQTISGLETRMKRADTLTRKSVKALETAVTALDAKTSKSRSTDKASLTRKVNQLSSKLTDMVTATQNSVNSELKTALTNPSVENLKLALSRADQKITQAEAVQTEAIVKINRHLAAMAKAVDAQISAEKASRETAMETLKSETSTKLDTFERDTAKALGQIGDKIIELSNEIKRRGEVSEVSIREKVSEIAAETQAEFDKYSSKLERRINAIESVDPSESRRLERTIMGLENRLQELELNVVEMNANSSTEHKVTTIPQEPTPAPAPDIPVQTAPSTVMQPPKLSVIKTMPVTGTMADAFTPTAQPAQKVPPNPYRQAQAVKTPTVNPPAQPLPTQDSHIPSEFNPQQFMRGAKTPPAPVPPQPLPMPQPLANKPLTDIAPQLPPIAPPPTPLAELQSEYEPETNSHFSSEPYANPAYAESGDTMADIRIGGEPESSFKTPIVTSRNLRVAAMATGVAVLGLIGAKTLLGGNNSDNIKAPKFVQTEPVAPQNTSITENAPNLVNPIGNYADNKPSSVTGEAAKTLNSAAAAGDAVAQFQLGLSYLEQGRTSEGVSLIRQSANQNQPAAQYRLAKLYEVGEGVEQDAKLARQLTERAARNGNRIAMHDLALYYAEGRGGVEAELPTAAKWFEKAAERGVVDSQFNLGVLFESGQGLPKNLTDAYVWYAIAAQQGDQFAKQRIDILSDTLPAEDLASAEARIKKFQPVKIDETANGIFRNVAWAKPVKDDTSTLETQVKDVQSLLSDLGYDIGGADGSLGPKTRAAIISFEQANGLPETGRINAALVDRLELAAGA